MVWLRICLIRLNALAVGREHTSCLLLMNGSPRRLQRDSWRRKNAGKNEKLEKTNRPSSRASFSCPYINVVLSLGWPEAVALHAVSAKPLSQIVEAGEHQKRQRDRNSA